jgi:hypothetical protein
LSSLIGGFTQILIQALGLNHTDNAIAYGGRNSAIARFQRTLNAPDNLPKTWGLTPIDQSHVPPKYRLSEEIPRRHNLTQQQLRVLQQCSDRE